jgi:hypothetical protein
MPNETKSGYRLLAHSPSRNVIKTITPKNPPITNAGHAILAARQVCDMEQEDDPQGINDWIASTEWVGDVTQ